MDTLESHRHAAIDLIQQGHRFSRQGSVIVPTEILPKVAPFAPPCYIPDPKVKECQILPCVDFEPKPNDSTRRVSPQTVSALLNFWIENHSCEKLRVFLLNSMDICFYRIGC